MNLWIFVLVLGLAVPSVVCKSYQFVVAPKIIRFNHDEVITVNIFGNDRNVNFKLWFVYDGKKFSEKTVIVQSQDKPAQCSMRIQEADIFIEEDDPKLEKKKPREIELRVSSVFGQMSKMLKLSYKSGYLIVQTDKPLYTPREHVKVRVLAMDEHLKPVTENHVTIGIITPDNRTIVRKTVQSKDKNGFFKDHLDLPPFPDAGIWTVKATFGGKFETYGIATFEVREFVLPTFGVWISTSLNYILKDTDKLDITVQAEYVYKKEVDGTAGVKLYLKEVNKEDEKEYLADLPRKPLFEGKANFRVNLDTVLNNRPFPVGKYLHIESTVFERATGKEEGGEDDRLIFASTPFKFTFQDSKTTYRPGVEYLLKVNMLYANDQPAPGERFDVQLLDTHGNVLEQKEAESDDNGKDTVTFSTNSANPTQIKFRVVREDTTAEHIVHPYIGGNQIEVERIITDDLKSEVRANTNINFEVGTFTGIMFMIVSRGQVIYTAFKRPSNKVSASVDDDIIKRVSPGARIIAYYVDERSNQLVADAVKFNVDPVCQGEQYKVKPKSSEIRPGEVLQLNVTGPNDGWVGFNILDKALLLLNSENVMKENKVFKELEAHDMGCGVGGGRNDAHVFETTGLSVLTNAAVSDRVQLSNECKEKNNRWKRSADECYYGANKFCCQEGITYAEIVDEERDDDDIIVPEMMCYQKAIEISKQRSYPMKCLMAFLKSCTVSLKELVDDYGETISRSILDKKDDYTADLENVYRQNRQFRSRTNFDTSFFFEELQLNGRGYIERSVPFMDSITEWSLQAIGISQDYGACVAKPVEVRSFKRFFVQLDLPYKATRLEHFDIKATVFNYDTEKTVNVYLKGTPGMCYGTKPGEPTDKQTFTMPANSARTIRFATVPLKAGELPVELFAVYSDNGVVQADMVTKTLYVQNEGIMVQKNIQVCLDPNKQSKDCRNDKRVTAHEPIGANLKTSRLSDISLALPDTAIPGTGHAFAYIESDVMQTVVKALINDVDSFFREPRGCGEQTMIYTAPIVYGMHYLKQTGQVTQDAEVRGTNFITNGITRERTEFMKSDGSYAAWKTHPTSLWLTAFVAKVFCQASHVVDGVVDVASLRDTLDYIAKAIEPDGFFKDDNPVIHREMQGIIGTGNRNTDPSLTSFVLISLQECKDRGPVMQSTIKDAMEYLENLPDQLYKNNPYFLAITTYALALSGSPKKHEFRRLLLANKRQDGDMIYWSHNGGGHKGSYNVETTSYALLALLQFDDIRTSEGIVMWLTSQRKSSGTFHTTQDTIIALQALAEYTIATYDSAIKLEVTVQAGSTVIYNNDITSDNTEYLEIIPEIPLNAGKIVVNVAGIGYGRMNIEFRYNEPAAPDPSGAFNLTIEHPTDMGEFDHMLDNQGKCDICGRCVEPDNFDYGDEENDMVNDGEDDDYVDHYNGGRAGLRRWRRNSDNDNNNILRCIRFKIRAKSARNEHFAGMSIVKVQLETGVEVIEEDLKKLVAGNIARYELPELGQGYIVFYLNKVTEEETSFIFRLRDTFIGDTSSRQTGSVEIKDYYKPERRSREYYSVGPNHGKVSVALKCNDDSSVCQCTQSTCVKNVEQEIVDGVRRYLRRGRRGQSIADKLYQYACDPSRANNAILVKIEVVDYSQNRSMKWARGLVLEEWHKGREDLQHEEVLFTWQLNCVEPKIQKEHTYLIIGKDRIEFGNEPHYSLMESTLVIDINPNRSNQEKKFIRSSTAKMKQLLKRRHGCNA